jgi:hypothetical protein
MEESSYFLSCSSIYCSSYSASLIFYTILQKDVFSSSFCFGASLLGGLLYG